MHWVVKKSLTYFQQFCVNVIKCGPIPNHIAFIMDGNRRFANKTKVNRAEGHTKGFEKLAETLQWCKELGIKEVTVYAFSIENFKRTQEEVNCLMNLATEKFEKLLEEEDEIMKEGVCVRVIGNLSLLTPKLRELIAKAVLLTQNNNKAFLNIALAYTSHDELTTTINKTIKAVKDGKIDINDINEDLVTKSLYTNLSPNPDILIRTSGEIRLSDFLLWQAGGSKLCFVEILWPEFNLWHLLACVFKYQRDYNNLKKFDEDCAISKQSPSEKAQAFLEDLKIERIKDLQSYIAVKC